jgi:hypothetical protein
MSFMKRSVQTLAATAAIVGAATAFGAPFSGYLENFETSSTITSETSDHKYYASPMENGGSSPLGGVQTYTIGTNPADAYYPWASFKDKSGHGNMMIINAAGEGANCEVKVFKSPKLSSLPAGDYELSYWVALSYGGDSDHPANPPLLKASVNGKPIGSTYNAAAVAVGTWTEVKAPFTLKDTGDAEIALCDDQTKYWGDDYALDDIAVTAVTAAALTVGPTDFCGPASYDNALVPPPASNPGQTTGWFTDLRRGNGINADYPNCQLELTGSVGSAGDMWITMLDSPDGAGGPAPTFDCPVVNAQVLIKKFDNRKGVGFVTHYNPGNGTGLFLGLYDNGNSDALTLSTFNGNTGQLTGTVATKALGSKVLENTWYDLHLEVCVDASITGTATVNGGSNNIAATLPISAANPGIATFGEIGIAGQAKSSFVDSSVRNFQFE